MGEHGGGEPKECCLSTQAERVNGVEVQSWELKIDRCIDSVKRQRWALD